MSRPSQVCEGVYMIGSADITDSMDCCVYVVDAGELVMIDTGAGNSAGRLTDNMHALGLLPESLSTIIVTHAHIDHIGSLYVLKERYGIKVIAHELDADAIMTGKRVGAEYYGVKYRPCEVDIILNGPENRLNIGRTEFRLLHVPGHTPGSLVVTLQADKKTVLFGQDIHGPYHSMWGGDIPLAIKSLQKIRALKADILCEGHYGIIRPAEEVEEFIQEFIDGMDRR